MKENFTAGYRHWKKNQLQMIMPKKVGKDRPLPTTNTLQKKETKKVNDKAFSISSKHQNLKEGGLNA